MPTLSSPLVSPELAREKSAAWKVLQAEAALLAGTTMRELFAADPQRAERMSLSLGHLRLDFSKNIVTDQTLRLLYAMARDAGVEGLRDQMFAGEKINLTENRAVLHVALRNQSTRPVMVDGQDVMPLVRAALAKMKTFCDRVRAGTWLGYSGKPIDTIVNIGIGGSDLGPVMVTAALKPYTKRDLAVHFVSNVDAAGRECRNDTFHCGIQDIHNPRNHAQRSDGSALVCGTVKRRSTDRQALRGHFNECRGGYAVRYFNRYYV